MKRKNIYHPALYSLLATLALTALPADVRADESPVADTAQNVADDVVEAAHSNPLRRRWAQMSDEERAQFLERRRAQAAEQGHSIRERLANLTPRQKAHLRMRLANQQRDHRRPLPPAAQRPVPRTGR